MNSRAEAERRVDDPVVYSVRHSVAEIVLNRPHESNAIDLATASALAAAVRAAEAAPEVAVLLLRGEGPRFCGGGDLVAMAAADDRPAFLAELARTAHEAVRAIDALTKPVVVAVQGAAAGVGFSLVLGADLVVAGESAKFVTAYTSVGLTPDGGLSWLLPRVVGQRRATELIVMSTPVSATRALDLGIASEVCADQEVLERARRCAQALAARPSHAIGKARRLVRDSWDRGLDDHLDFEANAIAQASAHPEASALISAFVCGR